MRRIKKTSFRPEQKKLMYLLRSIASHGDKSSWILEFEYNVVDLKEYSGLAPNPEYPPILDIVLITPSKKIGFRLNGREHERNHQQVKDDNQKILLEGNGWIILDIDWDIYPVFWKRRLSDYDVMNDSIRISSIMNRLNP
jgi:hypothetical protein